MTERERLIELMTQAENGELSLLEFEKKILADYLLENGVVVLPCKVGDTVYWIDGKCISEGFITTIQMTSDEVNYIALTDNGEEIEFYDFEIDETVFLTKEEAEQILKGGVENENHNRNT